MTNVNLDEINQMKEKRRKVLVTGATAGIGAATASTLAQDGYEVIVHGRNEARCATIVDTIQAHGGTARIEIADFSSLAQVHALAERLTSQNIDVIVNNAGVWMNKAQVTKDGFETTWQVNHLAPFLLTQCLLPALLKRPDARIINISSSGHRAGKINFKDINLQQDFTGLRAYCQSKLANVLFTQELARRTHGYSLITHAVDPGAVRTQLLANTGFNVPTAKSADESVKMWLSAVLGPDGRTTSGDYFEPNGKRSNPVTRDAELAGKLWSMSEKQVEKYTNL